MSFWRISVEEKSLSELLILLDYLSDLSIYLWHSERWNGRQFVFCFPPKRKSQRNTVRASGLAVIILICAFCRDLLCYRSLRYPEWSLFSCFALLPFFSIMDLWGVNLCLLEPMTSQSVVNRYFTEPTHHDVRAERQVGTTSYCM